MCIIKDRNSMDPTEAEDSLERKWKPTPVYLPGESFGQKILEGYSPWGHKRAHMV